MSLRVNNKLWLISDTHFGHKNIIKFQQRPESHEVIMLSNWLWRIGENDQVLHLGDVFMGKQGNPKRWAAVLSRMPGEKFVMMGNHDKSTGLLKQAGFEIIDPFFASRRDGVTVAFTHRPITDYWPHLGLTEAELHPNLRDEIGLWENWDVNIHGHVHGTPEYWKNGGYDLDKKYINVSVEVTGLAPVQLGNIFPF